MLVDTLALLILAHICPEGPLQLLCVSPSLFERHDAFDELWRVPERAINSKVRD